MTCWLFGHAPSQAGLLRRIHTPDFTCRRCGREIQCSDMPREVREKVKESRRAVAQVEEGS